MRCFELFSLVLQEPSVDVEAKDCVSIIDSDRRVLASMMLSIRMISFGRSDRWDHPMPPSLSSGSSLSLCSLGQDGNTLLLAILRSLSVHEFREFPPKADFPDLFLWHQEHLEILLDRGADILAQTVSRLLCSLPDRLHSSPVLHYRTLPLPCLSGVLLCRPAAGR